MHKIALAIVCAILLSGCGGPVGPKGDKGDQGNKGDKGDKGEKGDRGEKGDAAASPRIELVYKHVDCGNSARSCEVACEGEEQLLSVVCQGFSIITFGGRFVDDPNRPGKKKGICEAGANVTLKADGVCVK
jgi:hypothetical protein